MLPGRGTFLKIRVVAILASCAAAAVREHSDPDGITGKIVVATDLKVHTNASTSSAVVDKLNNGATVSISCKELGDHESGSQGSSSYWYRVNGEGFASAAFIAASGAVGACGPPTPPPPRPPPPAPGGGCQAAIAYGKSHLGSPYVGCNGGPYRQGKPAPGYQCFDGSTCGQHTHCENAGDIGFDCSGLMYAMWRAAGSPWPCDPADSSRSIASCGLCTHVSKSDLQPCDMMTKPGHHVVAYIGGGQVLQSSPYGTSVHGVSAGTRVSSATKFITDSAYLAVRCPI